MLKVYMDESGTHDDSPVITVGAYLARAAVWREWTKKWNRQKQPIKVFHATDCANLEGEFAGWELSHKNAYVAQLLPVIGEAELAAFVAGIRLTDYRELMDEYPELSEMIGDTPHTACFQWVLQTIFELMNEGNDLQRVAFFHEVNDYQGDALKCFDWIRSKRPGHFITLTFGTKAQYAPLQAADVLAYEGNRRLRDVSAPDRRAWSAINPTGQRRSLQYFDKPSLIKWAEGKRSKVWPGA